jgi:xanthine/uracil/vitamin C permease (AzgA family)
VRVAEDHPGGARVARCTCTRGGATLDLGNVNYTGSDWKLFSNSTFYDDIQAFSTCMPNNFTNVTKSDAIAAGGMFVMNQVRSAVDAYIEDAVTVEAGGSVEVTALETATINARSTATSCPMAAAWSAAATRSPSTARWRPMRC